MTKKIVVALAATSLLATPVLAQSVNALRAPAPVQDSEEVEGGSGIILVILAAAAVIAGIIIAADGSENLPTSP
ncbi:hypothetical protein [Alteraurantiacibacter aestuarii]|nr:hypothetical protein [Alteraurantiacibacter aestuarii]